MFYVCEVGRPFGVLAGPFNSEAEASAAAGAFEIEQPKYQARTEVWNYPAEPEPIGITIPFAAQPNIPATV